MAEKWHAQSLEEVARILETDVERGLTMAEAAKRHERFGFNELKERPPVSFWTRLMDQLKGFVVIILIVASLVSAALGDFIEAVVIMAIVVLNAAIGVIQESKAEAALAALKKMAAPDAQAIRDGHRTTVPSRELVPGDVVLLEAGNVIPADVRLVETANLKVDEASLTGESVPVNKRAEKILAEDASLGDRSNSAYMSTMVNYGRGKAIVVRTGMNTEIGLIAEMIQSFEEEETPLQKKLNELGRTLGIACLGICALVFAIGFGRFVMETGTLTFSRAMIDKTLELFMIAVALAIAAVPEGLPAIVTICLALGMREMVRRHALIRRLPAVETLGSATVICSDKTGTLTQNQMTVTRIWADGKDYQVTGRGYDPVGECHLEGSGCTAASPLEHTVLQATLRAGGLCNDADLEREDNASRSCRMVGDPTEGALVVAAAKVGFWRNELELLHPRVAEIPFDADRKRMTTIHARKGSPKEGNDPLTSAGSSYVAVVKGAPDLVLNCCTQIETIDGAVPLTEEKRKEILAANARMASEALRVLAMAYRPLDTVPEEPTPAELEKDCIFLGLQGMIDPARTEVAPAVAKARKAGLRTMMVTGDYAATAAAVAREIGILRPNGRVISGAEIEAMDDEALRKIIHEVDVCARVAPSHKVRIVEALKARGEVVSMTGDGVNDAPALKRANIGVAMGITGTDVTKQTADMVLTDDNYVSIVSAIEQGRIIYSNIRKFVYFLISCNLAEIAIIFLATLFGWPSPLTAIQLLWLNLLTDGAPALALGMEKGDPDIMERPPRPPQEPVINREMLIGTAVQTVAITSAVLIAYWRGMMWEASQGMAADVVTAETMAFVTLILSELFRAYTSRSERYPLFKLGVFTNKYMQYAVGFSILLLLPVVYIPALQPIFGTVSLTLAEWELIIPLVMIPAVANEVQKYVMNRIDRGKRESLAAATA
jgi:P-type Ca2+ transporter type 2C